MADQLDNHSVLVLYVSGELPEAQRTELEQRLEADATLRAEAEELRAAHAVALESLRSLDEVTALPRSQLLAAQRHTGRVMRQWQVDRIAKKPLPSAGRRMRLGWGLYSAATAAAAILLIGLYVYWDNSTANDAQPGAEEIARLNAEEEERLAMSIEAGMVSPSVEVEPVEQAMAQVQLLGSADRAGRTLWELQ